MSTLPPLIVLVGPTASGKTALGVSLARAFDGEIIAADSRTVYKECTIGTAKPTPDAPGSASFRSVAELFSEKPLMHEGIAHWGINIVAPNETYTAAQFQTYADEKISEIRARGHVPFLVGGTGLYVAAVVDRPSFAQVPPDPGLRIALAQLSNEELFEEIAQKDPDTAERIDRNNRRRLERAIEILRATGLRLAQVQTKAPQKYTPLMLGVDIPRETLYARIDERVDAMIAGGLINEARILYEKYGEDAPALSSIGYRQLCTFFKKKCTLKDAILSIKQDTRQYAKRQHTWFARDNRILWVTSFAQAAEEVKQFLHLWDLQEEEMKNHNYPKN